MAWLSEDERRSRVVDSTRDRTILVNQMLLAAVTLIAVLFAFALQQVEGPTSFLIGITLVWLAAACAVLVPWKRLPYWVGGVLPIVDIIAIGFLRESAPTAGLGLLWAFPAMWVGATFGVAGVIGVTVVVGGILTVLTATAPGQSFSASTVLLPLTVAALATISFLAARRAHAQRELLEKQSAHLQLSVDRARRQEDLVTEVLDAVDFGVIRITPAGELVVTNEAHARLQSTSEGGADDVPAFASDGVTPLAPGDAPLLRARAGATFENEVVWYGAPGEGRRALTVTARGLADIDGSPAGTIVVSRDVTNEEQALRAREDLVASVSHELRTPLTSIIGYLELVLDGDLDARARHDLEVAERNAQRLLELVTDILAISSVSRRGVEFVLHREYIDVAAIVHAAVEAVAPRAAERRIRIDVAAVQPASAHADAHRMRQVVDNLLANAVKYGRDGGAVAVAVSSDAVHVWIEVADDGPGISEGEQSQVFTRFFRADAVRNSSTHGSGLGLAISREIVQAHGGEILVASDVGQGSTFTVRLPVSEEGHR